MTLLHHLLISALMMITFLLSSIGAASPPGPIHSGQSTPSSYNVDDSRGSTSSGLPIATSPKPAASSAAQFIHIDSISPASGPVGTIVTLKGTGFDDPYLNLGFDCLDFDAVPIPAACDFSEHAGGGTQTIQQVSSSTIVFRIDDSTPPGRYDVFLFDLISVPSDGGEIASDNGDEFTVTKSSTTH